MQANFSFIKARSIVYQQLLIELSAVQKIDGRIKEALDNVFETKHINLQLLDRAIDQIRAKWPLKNQVKQLAQKYFELENFKWQVGGRQHADSEQTQALAVIYKQYLEHEINLKQLYQQIGNEHKSGHTARTNALRYIKEVINAEIKHNVKQFTTELGGPAHQGSSSTRQMGNLYENYLEGELNLVELFEKIDSAPVHFSVQEKSKALIRARLAPHEKKEVAEADMIYQFRVAVGGEQHLFSNSTNRLVDLYKNYRQHKTDLNALNQALEEMPNKTAIKAKEIIFRHGLGGNRFYESKTTLQVGALYHSYLSQALSLEELFYAIDAQAVHHSVKEKSKKLIQDRLPESDKALLQNYEKVQDFRRFVGSDGYLFSTLTNNITDLYKRYVEGVITLKTLYASMNDLAGEFSVKFMEFIFVVDVAGAEHATSRSTQLLAKMYSQFLKGEETLETLFYHLDDAKIAAFLKDKAKEYVKGIISFGDAKTLYNYNQVQAFRQAVGGGSHRYSKATNALVNIYKNFIAGDFDKSALKLHLQRLQDIDPAAKQNALHFIDLAVAVRADSKAIGSQVHKAIREQMAALQEKVDSLRTKKNDGQPYTLVETMSFLQFLELSRLDLSINFSERNLTGIQIFERDFKEINEYFRNTRQGTGFQEAEQLVKRSIFSSIASRMDTSFLANGLDDDLCEAMMELSSDIMGNIAEKKKQQPSITNHQREIYTLEDLQVLSSTITIMNASASHASARSLRDQAIALNHEITQKLSSSTASIIHYLRSEELQPRHFEKILSKHVEELNARELQLVVKAQRAFLEIQKKEGAHVDLAMLPHFAYLRRISQLRGENIDMAKMHWLIQAHHDAPVNPRVAIEGGGPVGLLLGITQFEAGANVSLFEKRSTRYERTQIVKLDPKWMDTLQFYLGEEYYKLFTDDNHRGVIRPDGFGEIATLFLEEAVHTRLSLLISMLPDQEGDNLPLERLAAYELAEVQKPEVPDGKFRLVANYQFNYDPAGKTPGIADATPAKVHREIDLLLCAGGKRSPMKERYLPSSSAVTQHEFYGVCSWLADDIPGQDRENMRLFSDFRNMALLDQDFFARYKYDLQNDFSLDNDSITASDKTKDRILSFLNSSFYKLANTDRMHVQTRTFENRGLIYIGMELPSELEGFLTKLRQKLEKVDVKSKEIGQIMSQVQKRWFQNIMHTYGLDTSGNLSIETIDSKFATMFAVDQYRIDPEHLVSHIKNGASTLLVAAAGDAFSSPHFMRYSGLTGGRENIFHLQDYTHGIAHKKEEQPLLETLLVDSERTAQFVISRGVQFLERLSDKQIDENKRTAVIASIENKIKEIEQEPSSFDYRLFKDHWGTYLLQGLSTEYYSVVVPEAGYVEIDGNNYDSIEQYILGLN